MIADSSSYAWYWKQHQPELKETVSYNKTGDIWDFNNALDVMSDTEEVLPVANSAAKGPTPVTTFMAFLVPRNKIGSAEQQERDPDYELVLACLADGLCLYHPHNGIIKELPYKDVKKIHHRKFKDGFNTLILEVLENDKPKSYALASNQSSKIKAKLLECITTSTKRKVVNVEGLPRNNAENFIGHFLGNLF
eukprot:CFRG7111T1